MPVPTARRTRRAGLIELLGSDLCCALLLAGAVVAVVVGLAARRVPIPLSQRDAMLPWSLEPARPLAPAESWDPLWWDGVAQFLTWRWILGDAVRRGQLPLWSPWSFCGQPLAANGQAACFYPPTLLLCWLLPPAKALAWLWALHVALAVGLTWGLARRLGASHLGGAVSGAAYAAGGFLLAWAPVPSLMHSAAWLPGALWGVEIAVQERSWRGVGLAALALAMAVLAGHMQVAGYVWLTTALWGLARVGAGLVAGRAGALPRLAAAFALALALAAMQALPAVELGRWSPRGAQHPTPTGFRFAKHLALRPLHLSTLVWPTILGHPRQGTYADLAFAEHFCGMGPVTLLLALVGVAVGKRRPVQGLLVVAAVSLLVAMGTPLAALLYYWVPYLGMTGGFQRTLFVFCLALALLAGQGVEAGREALARLGRKGEPLRRVSELLLAGAMAAQAAAMLKLLLPWAPAGEVGQPNALLKWMAQRCGPAARVLAITPRRAWTLKPRPYALLPPNTMVPYALQDVQGYDSLYPRVYKDVASIIEGEDPAPLTNGNMVLLENAEAWQLGELGVRYVLAMVPLGSTRLRRVATFQTGPGVLYLYERLDWRPRWRLAKGSPNAPVKPVTVGYNYARLEVGPGPAGVLEVADTPYPGWRAYVQGQPSAWYARPDLRLVRQVFLPACPQPRRVDLVFWPTTVAVGLFLSCLAVTALVALGLATTR
jgi:hypothetical protein